MCLFGDSSVSDEPACLHFHIPDKRNVWRHFADAIIHYHYLLQGRIVLALSLRSVWVDRSRRFNPALKSLFLRRLDATSILSSKAYIVMRYVLSYWLIVVEVSLIIHVNCALR
jgi:hypothetical protein